MSIFGSMKRSRDQKNQKAKEADKPAQPKPAPYRHVPTHAACDAVTSAPSGSRNKDHSRVRAANRERSAKAVTDTHVAQTSFPTVYEGSHFSTGSSSGSSSAYYQPSCDGDISPMSRSPVQSPAQSYGFSAPPPPPPHNYYETIEVSYPQPLSPKGKEVARNPYYNMPYSVTPADRDHGHLADRFQSALMI